MSTPSLTISQAVECPPVTAASAPRAGDRLSLFAPLAAFAALVLLAQPWGNYPLNDDWIYARIVKRFVETGKFVFDHDTGAAFIGQGWIAAPVIRLFGFSHTNLRLLTIAFGGFVLYLLWQLLTYAGVRSRIKAAALLTVVCNPVFACLSMSFMTEIYGYALALLAAVLWFGDRRRRELRAAAQPALCQEPVIGWRTAILTALAAGATFWIRQYCILVFPALLAATLVTLLRARNWGSLRRSLPRVAVACLIFAAVIAGYLLFAAKVVSAPMGDFSHRLHNMLTINVGATIVNGGVFLIYMTAFFFPLAALLRAKSIGRAMWPAGLGLLALGAFGALALALIPSNYVIKPHFPFLDGVLSNAGVGPLLMPDTYVHRLPLRPRWPESVWIVIECLLLMGITSWGAFLGYSRRALKDAHNGLAREMLCFGALFALGFLLATMVVDKLQIFDRYYLPEIFGLTLAVSVALSARPQAEFPRASGYRFAAALLPLAFFTAAGLHDYFQWNDARWALFRNMLDRGVSPANIQAGYETNGWTGYDLVLANTAPANCIGPCHCTDGWFCADDSYRIGMNLYDGYEVIDSRQPDYWLASGPPIYVSRRRAR